jgi:hypothetical protein
MFDSWAKTESPGLHREGEVHALVLIGAIREPPYPVPAVGRKTVQIAADNARWRRWSGIMKRLFKVAFFACGWIGLLLNLAFVLASLTRDAESGSALETALEALWIGGTTFFGLGALVLDDDR